MAIKFDTFKTGGAASGVTSVNGDTGPTVTLSGDDIAADHTASNYTAANANIDGHLSGIDTKLGTIAAGLTYKGSYNASTNSPALTNALQGDLYVVSAAGTQFGVDWQIGDHLLVNADMGGTIDNSKVDKIDNTEPAASETVAGIIEIATNAEAALGAATNKALVPSNISSLDLADMDNTTAGFISSVASASETVAGVIEIATNAEAAAGTATDRALVPSNISSLDLSKMDNTTSGFISSVASASETVAGIIEIATDTEAADGTATNKALVPSNISSLDLSAMDNTTAGFISSVASASETVEGKIEIATNAEAAAGTATNKAIVPSNISSLDLSKMDNTTSGFISSVASASETVAGIIEIATNAEAAAATATNKALVPSNISSLDLADMDNATAGFIANINSESLNDLSDVSYTAGAGIDNYVLTYDHSTTSWGAEAAASGGLSEVSQDPTPQLGGPLDTNGQDIVSASNGDIEFAANGTGVVKITPTTSGGHLVLQGDGTNSGKLVLNCQLNSHGVTIEGPPHSANANYTLTLPNNDGDPNQVLKTNGSGALSWVDQPAGASAASETVAGIIEIATNAEAAAATATDKALVPSNISSLDLSAMDNTTSGFIADIVTDTTPQLGGDLDVNGQAITSASNGLIEITPNGTGAIKLGGNTNPAEVRFFDEAGTNYVALKAPLDSAISADETFTLPATDGTNGQVLQTNGSGVLSFVDQSGGGSAPSVTTDSSGTNTTISTSTGIEEIHLISNGSTAVTITIPAGSTVGAGYKYNIKRLGTANVTVSPSSGTIDGASSFVLSAQYDSITVVSDNSNYYII